MNCRQRKGKSGKQPNLHRLQPNFLLQYASAIFGQKLLIRHSDKTALFRVTAAVYWTRKFISLVSVYMYA